MQTRDGQQDGSLPKNPPPPRLENLVGVIAQLTGLVERQVAHSAEQQANQAQTKSKLDEFEKKNPPSFYGKADPDAAESWKMRMEKKFEAMKCTDEERVRFAVFSLDGEAEHWWKTTKTCLGRDGTVITWEKFLEAFDQQYFPDSVREQKEDEFNRLTQGGYTVEQYKEKFIALSRFAQSLKPDDARKARKFVKGLKTHIREKLAAFQFESYASAVDRALSVEMNCPEPKQEQFRDDKRARTNDRDEYLNKRTKPWVNNKEETRWEMHERREDIKCTICGRPHMGVCYMKSGACFNCGEIGHLSRDCPKPRKNVSTNSNVSANEKRNMVPERVFAMISRDAKTSSSEK